MEWRRRWRSLQRWRRGKSNLKLTDSPEGIVRARRGEAIFVEVENGEEAQPIPTISTAAELGTATLAQWEDIIRRYGLPDMGPDASVASQRVYRFGESIMSGWAVRVRQGEPVLLRVRLRDLQVFGYWAALLFHSVNALRGQTFPLKRVLHRVPQDLIAPYLDGGGSLPSKENEVLEFAYRVVEKMRQRALAVLSLHNFNAPDTVEHGPVWDLSAPGWWELMVLTTLQGLKYREPRNCVNECGRLVPMSRKPSARFCSDACRNKYRARMKMRRIRAKGRGVAT